MMKKMTADQITDLNLLLAYKTVGNRPSYMSRTAMDTLERFFHPALKKLRMKLTGK